MEELFFFIEKLTSLAAPSIVVLQNLLQVTMMPTHSSSWLYYDAHPPTGFVQRVDFRVPTPTAKKHAPFLVLDLRKSPVTLGDVIRRYGNVELSDVSVHHPHFIGYRVPVNGRWLGINIGSEDQTVQQIAIDYSDLSALGAQPKKQRD